MNQLKPYRRFWESIYPTCHRPRPGDHQLVREINQQSESLEKVGDAELTSRGNELRSQVSGGVSFLDRGVLRDGFALVKQASRRVLGMQHYDVQLLAGIALCSGATAEMYTGEGKTLASTLPIYLMALAGQGIHVATVNSYLAARDRQHLSPLFELLGLSVGLSEDGSKKVNKCSAYAADITFATGYEFGFDFLRDQVTHRKLNRIPVGQRFRMGLRGAEQAESFVQRGQFACLIDEIDSVLLDEGATPLIISERTPEATEGEKKLFEFAKSFAHELEAETDFVVENESRQVYLTETGEDKVHRQIPHVNGGLARPWSTYIEQALRAAHVYLRDVNYVVRENKVQIVDEYTGRIFDDRTWRDGLHQAVECKEQVTISGEQRSLARISRQCYFRLYENMAGMTGTAEGHQAEFANFYRLPIVMIPRRKPNKRLEFPTLYFANEDDKWIAIVNESIRRRQNGQPVLIGTRTIANSHRLAELLQAKGIPHRLLNGVQDEDEADLIASAGETGTITIATNMAGRGTDIKPCQNALNAGGLHVIASERNSSIRIDRQLAGRAARQGDPGSSQFFVSADDDLIMRHDEKLASQIRQRRDRVGNENREFDQSITHLQNICEQISFAQRQQLLDRDLWLNEFGNNVA